MLFNSPEFLFLFLPVTLFGYYLIGKFHSNASLWWLTLASLVFYASGSQANLWLIIVSKIVTYLSGVALEKYSKRGLRFTIAFGCVGLNLAFLGFFKYADFAIGSLNSITGLPLSAPLNIILPLGISFWTFQNIAYIIDTYQSGRCERSLVRYATFISFFPQLIAGPIVHHKEMLPQFDSLPMKRLNWDNIAIGLTIFAIGLAKKMLIADNIAVYSTPVFGAAADGVDLTAAEAWVGVLSWTFQLYFDFSGYSDMATGLARMFAIKLPINFNSPYKATSIIDFWRRWHMTLSRFLRDYIYIPLGGNKRGKVDRYANLLLTMLIGGLWHGAAWTFLVWGGLHGIYLIINHAFAGLRERGYIPALLSGMPARALSRFITFIAVVVAWVFFRADSWGGAVNMLHAMFTFADALSFPSRVIDSPVIALTWIAVLLGVVWLAPNSFVLTRFYNPVLNWSAPKNLSRFIPAWHPTIGWAVVTTCVLFACGLSLVFGKTTEFIYFNF